MGFEPTTHGLGSRSSTTELHPLDGLRDSVSPTFRARGFARHRPDAHSGAPSPAHANRRRKVAVSWAACRMLPFSVAGDWPRGPKSWLPSSMYSIVTPDGIA